MTSTHTILAQLSAVFDGDPWYGSPLWSIVRDLSAERAAARPIGAAHSAWEIVRHITAWNQEVTRRLELMVRHEPELGDWPAVTNTSRDAWQHALSELCESYARLRERIAELNPAVLSHRIGEERDRPAGTGVTVEEMLFGIIHHNVYHSGQIAVLAKASL